MDYENVYQIYYIRGGVVWSTSTFYYDRNKAYRDASEYNRRPGVARNWMHAEVVHVTIAK